MRAALEQARLGASLDEVPVGAVIVVEGELVASAHNRTIQTTDPTAHAELEAIRSAARRSGDWRLFDSTLYVTLEPCAMCAGGIVLARVHRVVFGAWDEKAGMAGSVEDLLRHHALNHQPLVSAGVLNEECSELLRGFFRERR
jgi:tRNA(adenine34) deaminase